MPQVEGIILRERQIHNDIKVAGAFCVKLKANLQPTSTSLKEKSLLVSLSHVQEL